MKRSHANACATATLVATAALAIALAIAAVAFTRANAQGVADPARTGAAQNSPAQSALVRQARSLRLAETLNYALTVN
jgi:hypothetical protein